MKHALTFNVKTRPTKANPGRADVVHTIFEDDGKTVASADTIGKIRKVRGDAGYTAFVLDSTAPGGRFQLEGLFGTRAKAAHAILRETTADERAEKATKRAEALKVKADAKAAKLAAKAAKAANA